MADEMKRRRENASRAFTARRGELGLTQEQVARRGDIVVRTVQNFEAGKWPHASSRASLERAVGWAPGTIARLAEEPAPEPNPRVLRVLELASQLTDGEKEALLRFLRQSLDEGPPRSAASG